MEGSIFGKTKSVVVEVISGIDVGSAVGAAAEVIAGVKVGSAVGVAADVTGGGVGVFGRSVGAGDAVGAIRVRTSGLQAGNKTESNINPAANLTARKRLSSSWDYFCSRSNNI